MVTSDAALATKVGRQILESGGNAVDAAVAITFALAVVFPEAGNLGGGGFMVYRGADGQEAALDFRETAPAAATQTMYINPTTGAPNELSRVTALAAAVPGSVAGMWAAHKKFGSQPWASLVAPAIKLAREGFTVTAPLSRGLTRRADKLTKVPSTVALFYKDGAAPSPGTQMLLPTLAATLERIAKSGAEGFYKGETAKLIVAEMARSGGIITAADLEAYEVKWRTPVSFEYRGHRVLSMPPPSSGGLVLALLARATEDIDMKALGWHSPAHVHRVAETMRHAFARRNALLGDPSFVKIDRAQFESAQAGASVRAAFDKEHALPSSQVDVKRGTDAEGDHTTNFSVVDAAGNAVALTTTINTSYGSGVVVQGAGFLLNNEMDDFAAAPGTPNVYGLVQGEANAIAPGKRPLSSMTPTIVSGPNGKLRLVAGAAGGPTIITAVYQIISNVIDFDMDIQTAVAAPRVHHQHLPDQLFFEADGLPQDVQDALRALGHNVQTSKWPLGDAPSLAREGDAWVGAIEPRQEGAAAEGP